MRRGWRSACPVPGSISRRRPRFDGELEERIAKHRESRRDEHWSSTVEEPFALARAIREAGRAPTILVDCLTMWVGNLMWAAEDGAEHRAAPTEAGRGGARAREIVAACREHEGTVVFVTNEVGLGHHPRQPGRPPLPRPARPLQPGDGCGRRHRRTHGLRPAGHREGRPWSADWRAGRPVAAHCAGPEARRTRRRARRTRLMRSFFSAVTFLTPVRGPRILVRRGAGVARSARRSSRSWES